MEFTIYLIGVVILSAFYYEIKAALGGGVWFVLAVIAYLLCVRAVGYFFNRRFGKRRPNGDSH